LVDPVDYHLLLTYPDRDEPENPDFTSFTGKITEGDVLSLPPIARQQRHRADD
jgi:hypothetical protein